MMRLLPAAVCFMLAGCSVRKMPGAAPPVPHRPPEPARPLWVGAARVDVTPPPGPSTFGHGPESRVARGYWTRLYCRVFVLETSAENRVALVPCDLHSISALLHRQVAEKVRAIVPTSRLLLTATHTHAGPAHYFESEAYGGAGSSRRPGFDPAMLEFLAGRIARGIEDAVAARRPCAARWAHASVWKLTRNRSLSAFWANPQPALVAPPPGIDLSDAEKAIDPALRVLQIEAVDRRDGSKRLGPVGRLVLFAMHPTVLGPRNRLFAGDAFGVASRLLEAELRLGAAERHLDGAPDDPLVGILNTNEGDIAPAWSVGDADEAIRVGRALAGHAWKTEAIPDEGESRFRDSIVLDSRYLESELPGAALSASPQTPTLCSPGELGAAASHGASDRPTSFDLFPGSGSDVDVRRTDCQAPKRTMMGLVQDVLVGTSPRRYAAHAPLALVRLDDAFILFVPGEMTVNAGTAVKARILGVVRTEDGRRPDAAVVGLANSYLQYVATRAEYGVQSYEGASTLYGPATAEYFEGRAELLARAIMGERIDPDLLPGEPRSGEAVAATYETGPERARLPDSLRAAWPARFVRAPRGLCRMPSPGPPSLCFWWTDGPPGWVALDRAPWLSVVENGSGSPVHPCHVRAPLEIRAGPACDPGASLDDRGLDFQTMVRGRAGDLWLWSSLVSPSTEEWAYLGSRGTLRVRADGAPGFPQVESEPFSAASLPENCSWRAARFCGGDVDEPP